MLCLIFRVRRDSESCICFTWNMRPNRQIPSRTGCSECVMWRKAPYNIVLVHLVQSSSLMPFVQNLRSTLWWALSLWCLDTTWWILMKSYEPGGSFSISPDEATPTTWFFVSCGRGTWKIVDKDDICKDSMLLSRRNRALDKEQWEIHHLDWLELCHQAIKPSKVLGLGISPTVFLL